jgi:hypothetical protein
MLSGSLVAIVTPMLADGALDLPRLKSLIDWHVAEGTDGIVIVGTTGESPTVDVEEHCKLIEAAVQYAAKRVPVIAGTGGNSTREAIALTQFARKAGAAYALSVVPYYNKPTQEGLYRHFKAIAESTDIPMILYNVPSRTVADLANDTVVRLSQVKNIVGIKEATGSVDRVQDETRAQGLPRLQRRRHDMPVVHAPGRTWRDLGDRERGAEAHARDVRRRPRRKCRAGDYDQQPAARASQEPFSREQPHPGEVGARPHGTDRRGHPPAAHAIHGPAPRNACRVAPRGGLHRLDEGFTA